MAASLAKSKLTFCKFSSLYRFSQGSLSQRYKSTKNPNQDLRPEHVYKNDPQRIDEEPGPWKNYTDAVHWHRDRFQRNATKLFDKNMLDSVLKQMDVKIDYKDNEPVKLENPYQKPNKRCILCECKIHVNFKNPKLLSQFVSPYTGRIYGRHVTGLCVYMQRQVAREIKTSRRYVTNSHGLEDNPSSVDTQPDIEQDLQFKDNSLTTSNSLDSLETREVFTLADECDSLVQAMNEEDTQTDIRRLLECPVCMDSFNEETNLPIAVECQHTLCSTCIGKIKDNLSFTCPTCSCTSQLKTGDISKLPKDIARVNLMDIMKKGQKKEKHECTSCEEGEEATYYCGICNEYLCADCTASHKRMRKTKGHALENVRTESNRAISSGIQSQESSITVIMCEKHGTRVQGMFCDNCDVLLCDTCAEEDHEGHTIVPCSNVYSAKSEEISENLNKLREKVVEFASSIERATQTVCDTKANLIRGINDQFEMYTSSLADRKGDLLGSIDRWCNKNTEALNKANRQVKKLKELTESTEATIRDLDRVAFLKRYKALKHRLAEESNRVITAPCIVPLSYAQVCPTDEFSKIVTALGSVQERQTVNIDVTQSPDAGPSSTDDVISGDIRFDTTCSPLMEVLKSLSMHSGDSNVSLNSNGNAANFGTRLSLPDSTSIFDKSHLLYASMRIPEDGRKQLYDSPHVRQLTKSRLQTWDLTGSWEVRDNEVCMYSKTTEEAEQCLQLLSQSLVEKRVAVRKDTTFLLESDKWQILNRELERKYPQQVSTWVDHDSNEVVCHATSAAVIEDAADKVRLFLRDNQVKQITLTYSPETAKNILKCNKPLERLKNSNSQFCLQILKDGESSILVKGIGIGLGAAVKRIHALARKCEIDDDRFDSDDEEEDSEDDTDDNTRFEDDGEDGVKGVDSVAVQMVLGKTRVNAICLPGDNRTLYAVRESITKLDVEAVVNPADPKLKHDGGLAKILVKQGGRSIQDECTQRVSQKGALEIGDAYLSGAGTLQADFIIHAVGPKWKDGKSGEFDALEKAVYNSLQLAAHQRLSSLAIPAIGAGSYGMPVEPATYVIVRTVAEFLKNRPHCSIREVYFCDFAESTVQHFARALLKCFDRADVLVSLVKADSQSSPETVNSRTTEEERGSSAPVVALMM